ncbi:MAG: hypothetical protein ACOCWG_01330 [bacterium]
MEKHLINDNQIDEAIHMLKQIKTSLNLNVKLTPRERKDMASISTKRMEAIINILYEANKVPHKIPKELELDKINELYETVMNLKLLSMALSDLEKSIQNKYQFLGAKLYKKSFMIKKYFELLFQT